MFGMEEPPVNPIADHTFNGTFADFELYSQDPGQKSTVELMQRLAGRVVGYAPKLVADENPFEEGKILSIVSEPGRGKSHLVHAFLNQIKADDPRALAKICFHSPAFKSGPFRPAETPILIIDDLFSGDSATTSVKQLGDRAVQGFMGLCTQIWENRVFAIITCNYSVLPTMFERIRAHDMVGRSTSRLAGMMDASKEIILPGKDYRRALAEKARADRGGAFDI
jgi:hypothetical protein